MSGLADVKYTVPADVVHRALEVLRLTHIYALKAEHRDELPEDFKPHKWTDEVEFAQESIDAYRDLLNACSSGERTEQDLITGRWYVVDKDGNRLHGPYLDIPISFS